MQYIIDFKNEISISDINDYFARTNSTVIKTYNTFEKTYLIECSVELPFDANLHTSINRDDNNPITLLGTIVQLDKTFLNNTLSGEVNTIHLNNDYDWWKTFSLFDPNLESSSIQFDRRGTGTLVYILDSGIKLDHIEFTNRSVSNLFSFNGNFDDNNGHGTAIASVIIGNTTGITNATVKSVKIFDNSITTRQSDLVNALDAIYQDFLNSTQQFAVVNCSWVIDKNSFIEDKIQALINNGLYFVVAAGNNGTMIENTTPASMPNVITIGSYNNLLEPSDFSNYTNSDISLTNNQVNGGMLDGWAPGENIYVATINGGYGKAAGTSIAAGVHSAVLAYNINSFSETYILNSKYDTVYQTLLQLSFKKDNILELNDPKYSTSVNKISTIIDSLPKQEITNVLAFYKGISGKKCYIKVVQLPSDVKSIELLDDLPNGLAINDKGALIGIWPDVDLVTQNIVRMNVTKDDLTIIESTLELITIPNNFDIQTQSTGNNDLDVKMRLAAVACSINNCTFDPDCYNDCFDGYCLAAFGKQYGCIQNSQFCYCLSDIRLKENIIFYGRTKEFNLYKYNYIWDKNTKYISVMAQDLLNTDYANSVQLDLSGHYVVNYKLLKDMTGLDLHKKI